MIKQVFSIYTWASSGLVDPSKTVQGLWSFEGGCLQNPQPCASQMYYNALIDPLDLLQAIKDSWEKIIWLNELLILLHRAHMSQRSASLPELPVSLISSR